MTEMTIQSLNVGAPRALAITVATSNTSQITSNRMYRIAIWDRRILPPPQVEAARPALGPCHPSCSVDRVGLKGYPQLLAEGTEDDG